jgi:hypothetical protein
MPSKKWVESHRKEYNAYMVRYKRFCRQKAKWLENCIKEGNLKKAQELLSLKPHFHFDQEIERFECEHLEA